MLCLRSKFLPMSILIQAIKAEAMITRKEICGEEINYGLLVIINKINIFFFTGSMEYIFIFSSTVAVTNF